MITITHTHTPSLSFALSSSLCIASSDFYYYLQDSYEAKRPKLDPETKKRSQRMFGMLLGTLNKQKERNIKVSEGVSGINEF